MGTRVTPSAIHFADKALAGVPRLLDDLQRLVEDRETADIVFIVGREEVPIYAHRLILRARHNKVKAWVLNMGDNVSLWVFEVFMGAVKDPQ
ncbi:uncharacterized protein TNCV_3599091 [Trichonephila clavipes]|nr:uncharacterized protein TNCV_3599091 [Trichonephila clavipes]